MKNNYWDNLIRIHLKYEFMNSYEIVLIVFLFIS